MESVGFSLPCLHKFLQNNPAEELIECFNFSKKKQFLMRLGVDTSEKLYRKRDNINFQNSRTYRKPEKNQNDALTTLLYSGLKMDKAKTYKKPAKKTTADKSKQIFPLRCTGRNASYLAAIEDTSPLKRNLHLKDASTSTHDLNSQRHSDPQSWKRLNILHLFGNECELEFNNLYKESQMKNFKTPEAESCSSSSGVGSEYSKILFGRHSSMQRHKIVEDGDEKSNDYSHIYFAEDWECEEETPSLLKRSQSSAFELSSNDSDDWELDGFSDDEESASSDSVFFLDRQFNRSLSLQDLSFRNNKSGGDLDFSHRWSLEAIPSHSFVQAKDFGGEFNRELGEPFCQSTPEPDDHMTDEDELSRNNELEQVEYVIGNVDLKVVKKYKSKAIVASKALLRLSIYVNSGLLTIHVISAKKVESKQFHAYNSYVKVNLQPEHTSRVPWHTNIIPDTKTPVFDEKFSFELLNSDLNRRIFISLWNADIVTNQSEFLGCMSFGVTHVIKKPVNGWYRLLIQTIGERKHFASEKQELPITMTTVVQEDVRNDVKNFHSYNSFKKDAFDKKSIATSAYDIKHMAKTPFTISVEIPRGQKGFGFSVTWVQPVRVARVVSDSPSDHAGLKVGDRIIFIGNENVVKASDKAILKLIKNERCCLQLEVYRRGLTIMSALPLRHLEGITDSPPSSSKLSHQSFTSSEYGSSTPTLLRSIASRAPSSRIPGFNTPPISRTDFGCHNSGSWSRLNNETHIPADVARRYAIYQLVASEENFSNLTYFGLERYVEPLRSKTSILSSTEHIVLFQNIEELVWLSEGFVDRIMEGDLNSVGHSVGSVFQEKILELCGAYQFYCNGIHAADTLLTTKMLNPGFLQFLQDPPIPRERLDITSFIHRPVEHFREVLLLLQTILSNTETRHSDYDPLENAVETMKLYYKDITTTLDMLEPRIGTTGAMATMAAVTSGTTMEDLEQRLVFTKSAKSFKLCEPGRQWVFGSELQKQDGKTMKACWVMLFTDILVFTRVGRDKVLFVIEDPVSITSINRAYFNIKKKNTEFRLIVDRPKDNQNALLSGLHKRHRAVVLRAESTELKTMWQNYIQRQVWLMRGHEYSTTVNTGTPGTARKLLWQNAMSITENNQKLNHNAQTPSKKITGTFVVGKKRSKEPTFGRILPSSSGKRQFLLDFLEGRTRHVHKSLEVEPAEWDFDNDPIANMKGEELAKLRQQMLSRKLPNYFEGEYEEFFFDDDEEEHKSSRGSHSPAPTIRSNLSTPRKHKVSPVMKPKKLSFKLPIGNDAKNLKSDAKMNSQISLDGKDGSVSSKDSKDRAPSITDSKPFAHIADTLRGSLERLIHHGSPLLRYRDSPKLKAKEEKAGSESPKSAKDSSKTSSPKVLNRQSAKVSLTESPKTSAKETSKTSSNESPKISAKESPKPVKESVKITANESSKVIANESPKGVAKVDTVKKETDKVTSTKSLESEAIESPAVKTSVSTNDNKDTISHEVKPQIPNKLPDAEKPVIDDKKDNKEVHPNKTTIVNSAPVITSSEQTPIKSVPIKLSNESTPRSSPQLPRNKPDSLASLRKNSNSSSEMSINSQSSQILKGDDLSPKPTPDKIVASSINVMVPQEQKVYSEKFPPQTPVVGRREIRPTELHLPPKDKPILGVKALANLAEQNALIKSEAQSRSLTASPALKPRTFKPVEVPSNPTGSPQLVKERVQILNVSERQKVQMTYIESPLMKRKEIQTVPASPLFTKRNDINKSQQPITASPLLMKRSDMSRFQEMTQPVMGSPLLSRKADMNRVQESVTASPLFIRRTDINKIQGSVQSLTGSPVLAKKTDAQEPAKSALVDSPFLNRKSIDLNKVQGPAKPSVDSPLLIRKSDVNKVQEQSVIASPALPRKSDDPPVTVSPLINKTVEKLQEQSATCSPTLTKKTEITRVQQMAQAYMQSPLMTRRADAKIAEKAQSVTSNVNSNKPEIKSQEVVKTENPTISDKSDVKPQEVTHSAVASPMLMKKSDVSRVKEMAQSLTASPTPSKRSDIVRVQEIAESVAASPLLSKKSEKSKNQEMTQSVTANPVLSKRTEIVATSPVLNKRTEIVAASPALSKRTDSLQHQSVTGSPIVAKRTEMIKIQEMSQTVMQSPMVTRRTDINKNEEIAQSSPMLIRKTDVKRYEEMSETVITSPMLIKKDATAIGHEMAQSVLLAKRTSVLQVDKSVIGSPIPARRNINTLKKSPPVPPPRKFLHIGDVNGKVEVKQLEGVKSETKVENSELQKSSVAVDIKNNVVDDIAKTTEVTQEVVPVITMEKMDPTDTNAERKANSETSSGYQSEKASTDSPAVVHKEAKASPSREIDKMEFVVDSKPMSPKEKEQNLIKEQNKDSPSSKHKESSVSTGRLSPKKLSMSKSLSSESGTALTVIKNGDDSSEKISVKDKRLKQDTKSVKPSPDRKTTVKSTPSSAAASPKVVEKNSIKSGVASQNTKTSPGASGARTKEVPLKKDVKKAESVKKVPAGPVDNKGKTVPKTTDATKIKSSDKAKKEMAKPAEDAVKKSPTPGKKSPTPGKKSPTLGKKSPTPGKKSEGKDTTKAKKDATNATAKGKDAAVKKDGDKGLKSKEVASPKVSPKPLKKLENEDSQTDPKNVEAQGVAAKDASKSPLLSDIQTRIRHRLEKKNVEGRSREGSPRLIKMCNDNKEFYFDAEIEKDYPELVGSPTPIRRDSILHKSLIKERYGSFAENRRCGSFDEIQSSSSHHYDTSRSRNVPWRGLGPRKDSFNSHSERDLTKDPSTSIRKKAELSPSAKAGKRSRTPELNKQAEVELNATSGHCPPGSGQCGEEVDRGYVCYRRGSYNSHTHRDGGDDDDEELLRKECVVEVHFAATVTNEVNVPRRGKRGEGGGGGGGGGGEPPNKCLHGRHRQLSKGVPYCVIHNHKKAWREVAVYAPPLDYEEPADVNNARCSPAAQIESGAELKQSAECVVPNGDELGRLGSSLDDMLKCEVWLMNQCGNMEISSAKQSSVSEENSSAALASKKGATMVRKTSKCEPTSDSPPLVKDSKSGLAGIQQKTSTPKTPRATKENLSKGPKSSPKTPNKGSSNSSRVKSALQKDDSKCSPGKTSKESRSLKTPVVNGVSTSDSTNTSGLHRKNSDCKQSKSQSPKPCSKSVHPQKSNVNNNAKKQCISDLSRLVVDLNTTSRLNEINYMASTSKDGPILINDYEKPCASSKFLAEQESLGSDLTDDIVSPPPSTVRAATISNGNVPALETSPLVRKAAVKMGAKSKPGMVNSPKVTRRDSASKLAPSPLAKEIVDLEATHSPNRRQSTGSLVRQDDEKKGRFNIFGGHSSPGSKAKGGSTESDLKKSEKGDEVKSEKSKSSWFSWKSPWKKSIEDCASLPGTPPNHTPQMIPRGVAKPTLLSPIRHGSDGDLNSWFADK